MLSNSPNLLCSYDSEAACGIDNNEVTCYCHPSYVKNDRVGNRVLLPCNGLPLIKSATKVAIKNFFEFVSFTNSIWNSC